MVKIVDLIFNILGITRRFKTKCGAVSSLVACTVVSNNVSDSEVGTEGRRHTSMTLIVCPVSRNAVCVSSVLSVYVRYR